MGTEITSQGDEGDEFFVVVEGGIGVGRRRRRGHDRLGRVLRRDGPDRRGERVATVTATTPMKVLVLDRHDFNEMLSIAMPEITPSSWR